MISKEIQASATNASHAVEMAEELCVSVIQDWGLEVTYYNFEDKSVLEVCGSNINAFRNMQDLEDTYNLWNNKD